MAFISNPSGGGGSGVTTTVTVNSQSWNFTNGSLISITDPFTDYAIGFNGSDYVAVGNNAAFFPAAGTLEFWTKTTDGSSNGCALIGNWNAIGGVGAYTVDSSATIYLLYCGTGGIDIGSIADGDWHHIAVTWDGTTVTGYFDGSPMGTVADPGMVSNDLPLWIGANGNNSNGINPFTGTIDEVRFYSRCLTGTEITAAFNHPAPVDPEDETDLVAYWSFNDGSGDTATDSSGNGFDATLTNSPSWVTGVTG